MFDQIKVIDSAETSVKKLVFSRDDAVAEAVLYRYPTYAERTVICCSTQSGCPVGCRFCGAGDAFVRNLTGPEIARQVDHAVSLTETNPAKMKRLQIMFMSMGEPLLNPRGMRHALERLSDQYPNAALLVSTIGPDIDWNWFMDLSRSIPQIGLQFSIHKSTDTERTALIPFQAKLRLKGIAERGVFWWQETSRKPFINYCAADDNTTDADADRLEELFSPVIWECTVSVICERNEGMPARNAHQERLARDFASKMLDRGFNVRVFDPAGQDDIGGGCGQLWFVQEWMKKHPELARPSIGAGRPEVHTPFMDAS